MLTSKTKDRKVSLFAVYNAVLLLMVNESNKALKMGGRTAETQDLVIWII